MPRKQIAQFEVPYLQILDAQGQIDPQLDPQLPTVSKATTV